MRILGVAAALVGVQALFTPAAADSTWSFQNGQWNHTRAMYEPEQGLLLADEGHSKLAIVVSDDPTIQERTAAGELGHYLERVTGARFLHLRESDLEDGQKAIFVGKTKAASGLDPNLDRLGDQEWRRFARDGNLFLFGGAPRGTLYGVYHFLENEVGVHWWTRSSETVPSRPELRVSQAEETGKPAFSFRGISQFYDKDSQLRELVTIDKLAGPGGFYDGGRFAARNRLLDEQRPALVISPAFGGGKTFNPPYPIHTFYWIIPPDKYFAKHPEWFSLINGQRQHVFGQLDVMNPELRAEYLKNVREHLEKTRDKEKSLGFRQALYLDVSANDWEGYDEGIATRELVRKEGTEMAPILDFANFLAKGLEPDFPEVLIRTLAYKQTEPAPKTMKADDRVIITVTDTVSRPNLPITAPGNTKFLDLIKQWKEHTKELWVWDYANAYGNSDVLAPVPFARAIYSDLGTYREVGVSGVKVELGDPFAGEQRDLLYWILIKGMEDPTPPYETRLKTFTDGFYGPAGAPIREYYALLEAAAGHPDVEIPTFGGQIPKLSYLTPEFFQKAHALFDQAEAATLAATASPEALLRLRQARRTLDEASVRFASGQAGKEIHISEARDALARYEKTQNATIDAEILPHHQPFARMRLDQFLAAFQSRLPEQDALPDELKNAAEVSFLPPGVLVWNRSPAGYRSKDGETRIFTRFVPGTSPSDGSLEIRVLSKGKQPFLWSHVSQHQTHKVTGVMPLEEVTKNAKWICLGTYDDVGRSVVGLFGQEGEPIGPVYTYTDFNAVPPSKTKKEGRSALWVRIKKAEGQSESYRISGLALAPVQG